MGTVFLRIPCGIGIRPELPASADGLWSIRMNGFPSELESP